MKVFENDKFTFNDAKGVEFVESYKRMYDAGALIPEALTQNYTGAGAKFMAQQTALNSGSAYDLDTSKHCCVRRHCELRARGARQEAP